MIRLSAGLAGLIVSGWSATAAAQPPLWIVEHNDAKVYMVGTIHLMRDDSEWRTEAFDAAFEEADSVWLEIANIDQDTGAALLVLQLGMSPDKPLDTLLNEEELAQLAAILEPRGLPIDTFLPLRPWFAALQLTTLPLQDAGFDFSNAIDVVIAQEARAAGKDIYGFETAGEQLSMMAGMPEDVQLEMLRQTLEHFDSAIDELIVQLDAWIAGDMEALEAAIVESYELAPELYDALFVQRNHGFVDRIEKILAGEGVTLVAVGLGHFAGHGSIPEILVERGYTVDMR